MSHPKQPGAFGPTQEWINGYEAAVRDAIALVEGLAGPSSTSLSSPALLRMKTRLTELVAHRNLAA